MYLSIYCEGPELADCYEAMSAELQAWLQAGPGICQPVQAEDRLGICWEIKKSKQLKVPLNFLYDLAKQHKQEFVICQGDDSSSELEEVCYFGHEEGKPDIFEVACYLGLE